MKTDAPTLTLPRYRKGGDRKPWGRSLLLRAFKLIAVCIALSSTFAHAHTSGASFLKLHVTSENTIAAELDFDLRDLHQLLQLDTDQDSALSWGEIHSAQGAIESLVLARTQLTARHQSCSVTKREPIAIAEHGAGPYARLSLSFACNNAGSEFNIDHSGWFAFDPGHRALLEYVDREGLRTQTILSQSAPRWRAQESFVMRMQRFWVEGAIHLVTGYDHLAFLAVLLLALARRTPSQAAPSLRSMLRRALVVITAFTVAHSFTLVLAATGHLVLPSKPVEIAIAASVVIAALLNLWRSAGSHGWKLAFTFGLVHGLGFAGALAELTSEHIDLLALAAFNVGIEAAQLLIALAVVPVIWWTFRSARTERIGVPAASILVAGVAAFWVMSRVATA